MFSSVRKNIQNCVNILYLTPWYHFDAERIGLLIFLLLQAEKLIRLHTLRHTWKLTNYSEITPILLRIQSLLRLVNVFFTYTDHKIQCISNMWSLKHVWTQSNHDSSVRWLQKYHSIWICLIVMAGNILRHGVDHHTMAFKKSVVYVLKKHFQYSIGLLWTETRSFIQVV